MYSLPYITLSTQILVPHIYNSYSINLTEISNEETVKTRSFTTAEGIFYENAFLIVVAKDNKTFSNYAALVVLTNKTKCQKETIYTFFSLKKVRIVDVQDNNEIKFHFSPSIKILRSNKSYNSLISFIKSNSHLDNINNNVDLNCKDRNKVLNQIVNYLHPNIEQDYNFFNTNNVEKKLNIINLLIVSFETSFISTSKKTLYYYPDHVQKELDNQLRRLKTIPNSSSEYSTTLDCIELIQDLPWSQKEAFQFNKTELENKLDSSHFGLNQVKKEIVDHFAFEQLTQTSTGNVLLFQGPPGTGKTSVAKAIAKATDREFIAMSLGGVSDEAEIRGHRRTYVGSRPGRLIKNMQKLTYTNPVIMLDEVDKISKANKGDPSSALLELLDPEQNSQFIDKFLEIPYDFSQAIFICTSNNLRDIPPPLLDRLSILFFKEYSSEEKYRILTEYMLPEILSKYDLETYNIIFHECFFNLLSSRNNLRDMKKKLFRVLKYSATQILSGCQKIEINSNTYYDLFKDNKEKRIGF